MYTGDRKNQHFCAGSRAYVCCCCLQLLRCLLLLLLRSPRGHIAILVPVHVYVHTVIPWYTYVYSYTMVVLEYSSTAYSVHVYVHGTRAIAIVWANRCTARQFRAIRRLFFSTVVPFALATSLSREAFTLRSTLLPVYTGSLAWSLVCVFWFVPAGLFCCFVFSNEKQFNTARELTKVDWLRCRPPPPSR